MDDPIKQTGQIQEHLRQHIFDEVFECTIFDKMLVRLLSCLYIDQKSINIKGITTFCSFIHMECPNPFLI